MSTLPRVSFKRYHPRPVRRFVASGDSMTPSINDGDGLVAVRWPRAKVGQHRVVEHPDRPGTWLVKRVESVGDDRTMRIASDNPDATRADSRTFGSLPVAGSYRVVLRVPARWIKGPRS